MPVYTYRTPVHAGDADWDAQTQKRCFGWVKTVKVKTAAGSGQYVDEYRNINTALCSVHAAKVKKG
jgi:hypothetical protein